LDSIFVSFLFVFARMSSSSSDAILRLASVNAIDDDYGDGATSSQDDDDSIILDRPLLDALHENPDMMLSAATVAAAENRTLSRRNSRTNHGAGNTTTTTTFESFPQLPGAAAAAASAGGTTMSWWRRLYSRLDRFKRKKNRPSPTRYVDPKLWLSNERTFIAWLDVATSLGSIAAGLLGFAGVSMAAAMAKVSNTGSPGREHALANALAMLPVVIVALAMLPIAIGFSVYAIVTFQRRAFLIRRAYDGPYEELRGPRILAAVWCLALLAMTVVAIVELSSQTKLGKKV